MSCCPLCECADLVAGPQLAIAPKHHLIRSDVTLGPNYFGSVSLFQCPRCTHMFNIDSTDEVGHINGIHTNTPVSHAMHNRQIQLLRRLSARPGMSVLEIGAGSGSLALKFVSAGHRVTVVEPLGHFSDELVTSGSRLFHSEWPVPELLSETFDLVLCVQVLEHTLNPTAVMHTISAVLGPNGYAYIEVPSADWVLKHGSPLDIHIPHVQYFTEKSIKSLFESVGVTVISKISLLDGHDVGWIVKNSDSPTNCEISLNDRNSHARSFHKFRVMRDKLVESVGRLPDEVALFGANAHLQALLGWVPTAGWKHVFDSTSSYWGHHCYSSSSRLEVLPPEKANLQSAGAIVIASYLHDHHISETLRASGYSGKIFSVRPNCDDTPDGVLSLF